MFSGNWSLNVLKEKYVCVWERRGETKQSSVLHAGVLGVSVKSTGGGWAVGWARQWRPEETHRYTATPGKGRVRASPKPQPMTVSNPPAPYVFLCFMDISGEQLPHKMTPDKRGSKCWGLMSCRLLSISLGGRYFPTEPFTRLGRGYNGWQTRDQSSLLLDSSTRDLTTIFHSADEL